MNDINCCKEKKILVPLLNRPVPVIFDDYVEMEFGTGALKVTPAHDINDYNLGLKYKLEVIDIFNPDGTLSNAARLFVGEDRFAVREKIVEELKKNGHIVKIESYPNKVGFSQRTDEVIEPRISVQWFMKMKELAKPALDLVENDTIRFYPAKYKNMYRHWMENVTDWCISRQLWWGQRIPAYYLPDGNIVVARTIEDAVELANSKVKDQNLKFKIQDMKQDEDVLDTWFSSWLWPMSVFDGIRNPDNPDINYYYPTTALITAPDIIFFWVARMIMAGWEYRKQIPFKDVYFTGMVRDTLGRKMSKSLGNSPDPLLLIEQFGADAVRVGMLLCSPAGNDLLFDEGLIEQGRNFSNKIWNALRLVKGWEVDVTLEQPDHSKISVEWFHSVLNKTLTEIEDSFDKYRLSEILMAIYKLVWDDFCSWYLEMIKPAYQQPMDQKTYNETVNFFEQLVEVLHPFMPFITEEVWQMLRERHGNESIMFASMPQAEGYRLDLAEKFTIAEEVIMAIRTIRKEKNIPFKDPVNLFIKKNNDEKPDTTFDGVVSKMCNLSDLKYTEEKVVDSISFSVKNTEFYIPLLHEMDHEAERVKLTEELNYLRGFLASVLKKLGNEKFVINAAPQVVESERKKKADAENRIMILEKQIRELMNL